MSRKSLPGRPAKTMGIAVLVLCACSTSTSFAATETRYSETTRQIFDGDLGSGGNPDLIFDDREEFTELGRYRSKFGTQTSTVRNRFIGFRSSIEKDEQDTEFGQDIDTSSMRVALTLNRPLRYTSNFSAQSPLEFLYGFSQFFSYSFTDASGNVVLSVNDASAFDQSFFSEISSGSLAAGAYTVEIDVSGRGSSFEPSDFSVRSTLTLIPVPAALPLFGSGLIGLVLAARRNRR